MYVVIIQVERIGGIGSAGIIVRWQNTEKNSILINTARGPVVDEEALVQALANGHLTSAGLDVFEEEPTVHPELVKMEQVVLLPHIASATWETRRKMATMALENVIQVLRGERPTNAVNEVV